ncbi:uncharacterized protein N7459_001363 [Penicillium hispanicum]|uniref:uncharacterized protein n=1 Tax=Penicillium hispanicum TaxID=1080232 RepID=UPI0025401AD7|nr:uncharacterized protein N7459_001363 [Penicillium hispanicum]KAJ5595155.1 hypothetical protein N7459_001363 [Penicillium hispanicum]
MPILTLHLLALDNTTDPQLFLQQLQQTPERKVILASRPRHIVIHPTILDNDPLATQPWDLLLLLQTSAPSNQDPLPPPLRRSIKHEYAITTGIPSKLLSTYAARDTQLKQKAPSIPLTGSLDHLLREDSRDTSQNLEVSPGLLGFMDELSRTHRGPVTMLNLLHFHHPDGKAGYYQYGQAFVPVAGKRGGSAKLVGNVVSPSPGLQGAARGSRVRPAEEWWNEISIVHYPSIRHFCDMLAGEDYQAINEKYRLSVSVTPRILCMILWAPLTGRAVQALRDTFLLCTTEFDIQESGSSKL